MSASFPNILLKIRRHASGPLRSAINRLWALQQDPMNVQVHGYNVMLNGGNNYPLIVQDYRWFNAPLVELCQQAFLTKGKPVTLVDIGAATGDSVLLIKKRCPGAVGKFICIEGDAEFHKLVTENLGRFSDVIVLKTLLAREEKNIPSLVKHHKGTATAIGDQLVKAVRLDSLAAVIESEIDVLKIDVDGFDGEVLAGAKDILSKQKPAVIFEWHPKLVVQSGNDPVQAFTSLAAAGYARYLWFNNPGTFSHFSMTSSDAVLQKHAEYLLAVNSRHDEHFDVIAMHESSALDDLALARLEHARACANCR